MVIINCRYGFANQLYHFAAGYSLACARGDELFIDCSYSYNGSVMGYLVDELQIDDYKKIEYDFAQNDDFNCFRTIPLEIGDMPTLFIDKYEKWVYDKFVFQENINREIIYYEGLEHIYEDIKNIQLSGCFQGNRFFSGYWEELRRILQLKEKSDFLEMFDAKTENCTSVGVHVRRRGFALIGLASELDYYRAAIQYIKRQFGECEYFFFSDDMEWLISNFDNDSHYHFVKCFGGLYSDMEEFFALSHCKHKILSRSSSYGRMASLLCGYEGQQLIYYGETPENALTNIVYLNDDRVKKLIKEYSVDNKCNMENCSHADLILKKELSESDDIEGVLHGINKISMNVKGIDTKKYKGLCYKKMQCLYWDKRYERALECIYSIYPDYMNNYECNKFYYQLLLNLGKQKESTLYLDRAQEIKTGKTDEKFNFIIVPSQGFVGDIFVNSFIELGIVLKRIGHSVAFICEENKGHSEYATYSFKQYLEYHNNHMVDCMDYDSGCNIYDRNEGKLEERFCTNLKNIIISDDLEFLMAQRKLPEAALIYIAITSKKFKCHEMRKQYIESVKEYGSRYVDFVFTDIEELISMVEDKKLKYFNMKESGLAITDKRKSASDIYYLDEEIIDLAKYLLDVMGRYTQKMEEEE